MRIKIVTENLKLSPAIRKMVNQKIGRDLEKYLPQLNREIKTARVKLVRSPRWGYRATFNLWLPKKYSLYAESHQNTLRQTLTDLRDKLRRQVKKYQGELKK